MKAKTYQKTFARVSCVFNVLFFQSSCFNSSIVQFRCSRCFAILSFEDTKSSLHSKSNPRGPKSRQKPAKDTPKSTKSIKPKSLTQNRRRQKADGRAVVISLGDVNPPPARECRPHSLMPKPHDKTYSHNTAKKENKKIQQ